MLLSAGYFSTKQMIEKETIKNPYGQGDASGQVIKLLTTMSLSCKKQFYDIDLSKEL